MSEKPKPPGMLNFSQRSLDGKQIDYLYYPENDEEPNVYLSYDGETDTLTINAKNIVFKTDNFTVDKP